ncbi:hypothetical protein ACFFWC_25565 [Plantactinospora siamensis]|uniref:Uncharacterized protein n=1 Tax=Plantactinospora siamensis TaxID=555372 RepID=A0ABV6NXX1_9ACTN
MDKLSWIASWGCLGLGALALLGGAASWLLVRRRFGRAPGWPSQTYQTLLLGCAFALMGLGNLLGGWWLLLVLAGMLTLFALNVPHLRRLLRRHA